MRPHVLPRVQRMIGQHDVAGRVAIFSPAQRWVGSRKLQSRPPAASRSTAPDVRARTLLVERAVSLGEEKDTKTRAVRTVNLLAPLAEDLANWRMICRDPAPNALVFPKRDGRAWTDADYRS